VQDYLRWFVALIGVWLMITVITIDVGAASKWNDLVVGFVVFISSAVLWEGPIGTVAMVVVASRV
jgi:hypothetical protein